MKLEIPEHPAYRELARARVESKPRRYAQPEDFGYDFSEWVSPYTKSAHARFSIAFILQDWASSDALQGPVNLRTQELGYTEGLLTNSRLHSLLDEVLRLSLDQVYVTNVFPFIKRGGMSDPLNSGDVVKLAKRFCVKELEIVQPRAIAAFGVHAQRSLKAAGVKAIGLPHPAARISRNRHKELWVKALRSVDLETQ